ncbi:MAG: hypothetical protein ACE5FW_02635 [Candidatus Aenigmatarchaeota archaeon]
MVDWDSEAGEFFGEKDDEAVTGYRDRIGRMFREKRGALEHSDPNIYMNAATEINSYIAKETRALRKTGFWNEEFYREVSRISALVDKAATPGMCDCGFPDQGTLNEIESRIEALRYDMAGGGQERRRA